MRLARSRRASRGMTLVEILVVVVIIGVLAALATLSIGLLGEDRELEDESRRLADAIALLQEQAQLEGRDYGILLESARYEFQRFDAFEQRWAVVEGDPALRTRELPPDLGFELVHELSRGRPLVDARIAHLDDLFPLQNLHVEVRRKLGDIVDQLLGPLLAELGIAIERRVPVLVPANPHSQSYLEVKRERMQHDLGAVLLGASGGEGDDPAPDSTRRPIAL